jgi:cytochrome c oxidase subunit 4
MTEDHSMTSQTAPPHAAHVHIVPVRVYLLIFLILIACTALTVAVAFVDLGFFNVVAALSIAVFKATLVVLFFMHVKYSTKLTWAVVLGSLFWLAILLTMTAGDYLTRAWRTYG